MNKITKKEKARLVCERLETLYPSAVCSLEYKKPHELLIATRLSAQCTDKRVNEVTPTLFERFPSLEAFAEADVSEIERIILPCGLYKTKAKSIKEMAIQLINDFDGELPNTIEGLTSLSGIGRKTANLIMGDVFHQPAVVVDTHCLRITKRLGLTSNTEPVKVEADLRAILPPEKSSDFCHRLVIFGRDVCKARGERCGDCCLCDLCDWFRTSK